MQLPVLEIDGRKVAQTGSIMRLLSRLARKDVADAVQASIADSAFEAAQEVPMAQIYVALNLMEKEQAMHTAAKFKNSLPRYLANWTKILDQTAFLHGAVQHNASKASSSFACSQHCIKRIV